MIEAVLFDYGLVLTGPPVPEAWAEMLQITQLTDQAFTAAYWFPRHDYDRGTHTGEAYWLAVGAHAGLSLKESQVAALIEADNALWTAPNQPMIDWAARLQSAGTRTGILSNLGDQMTAGVLARMPWLDAFHHRTFSHTLHLAKPELAIYQHSIAGLATSPERILFIDDRPNNCQAGRASGMQVVQYVDLDSFVREMESRSLGDLWRSGRDAANK